MKEIQLTDGGAALVDDEDYAALIKYRWRKVRGYAVRGRRKGGVYETLPMHRVIMNAKPGQITDHVNRNRLDNRKTNLRFANPTQNCANRSLRSDNKTGFKGVTFLKSKNVYRAYIQNRGAWKHLGYFSTAEEAHAAYVCAASSEFGEFSCP